MLLDVPAYLIRLRLATFRKGHIATNAGNPTELHEHFIQEKTQPDAFAFAAFAHNVHAVVPVSGTDEWQAVLAKSEASQDRAHTVFVQACRPRGPAGQIVI